MSGAVATVTGALMVGFALPSVALADSATIAGAPTVTLGQQEFGNTASVAGVYDDNDSEDDCYRSYWLLGVTAGDQVTIDWESDQSNQDIDVFPGGTTDYNVDTTAALENQHLTQNDKNELIFTSNSTATLPLSFRSGCEQPPGPYDFTVTEIHALVLSLSGIGSSLNGTATVGAHDPDGVGLGAPVELTLRAAAAGQGWITLAGGTPSGGTLALNYSLPRAWAGKTVKFQALGGGAGYQSASSGITTVRLPSPPCVVPKLGGLTLASARRRLAAADCTLGTVRRARSSRHNRGRVIAQSPGAKHELGYGAHVSVLVGR